MMTYWGMITGKLGCKISYFLNNSVIISDKLLLLLKMRYFLNSKYNQGVKGAYQELVN